MKATAGVSVEPRRDVQRRTLRVLVVAQLFAGIGLASGISVAALLARDLLGGATLSGLPIAVAGVGGALAALPLSRLMARSGRRPGLAAGYLTGASGCAVVLLAAELRSFPLLVAGMMLFGVGNTAGLLARYAATDLALAERRGRAVSTILFATAFGAIAGPNLVAPAGALAESWSLPSLAGPFVLSLGAYVVAAAVITVSLRPDPLLTAGRDTPVGPARSDSSVWGAVLHGPALAGLLAMVGAQFVMVAMMSMTPLHMSGHGHGLGVIGFIISLHIAGMYLFSPVGGYLNDRFGSAFAISLGAGALLAAGLLGALASPASVALLAVALFLLGLGWGLSLVGGTSLLTASVSPEQRVAAQGNADVLVGLAGASGGISSGVLLAFSGFGTIGLVTAVVAAVLLVLAVRRRAPLEVA